MKRSLPVHIWWIGCAVALLLLLALVTRLDFPPQYDESPHQNFVKYIAAHPTFHTLKTYEGSKEYEAKGPFFFGLSALYGSVVGFELPALRILTLLFAIATIFVTTALLRVVAPEGLAYQGVLIILLPYFLILSITFMTDVPTLCLFIIAAYGYLRELTSPSGKYLWLGVLAATAAAYIRVDSCYMLPGIFLSAWRLGLLNRRLFLALLAPFILRLPLVLLWGGLAAPPAHLRPTPVELGISSAHLVFAILVFGFYFWPFLFVADAHSRYRHLTAAAIAALSAFFIPQFAVDNVDQYGGVLRTVALAVMAPPWVKTAALAALTYVGALVCLRIFIDGDRRHPQMMAIRVSCAIGLAMQAARGAIIYERYLIHVSILLFIVLLATTRQRIPILIWAIYAATLQLGQLIKLGIF